MTAKKYSILAVDDNATILRSVNEICRNEYKVFSAPTGNHALAFLENVTPDIILLDIEMPDKNGFEIIRVIKSIPRLSHVPIIFLTGIEGRANEEQAFKAGAVDYITKPVSAGVLLARLSLHLELVSYREHLEDIVTEKTMQISATQDAVLEILAHITNYRDRDTGSHIRRTTAYVQKMVEKLSSCSVPGYIISEEYAINIIKSAKLHDIGKVAIPDNILLKPGNLTPDEFEVIKKHTTVGAQMIDQAIVDLGDNPALLTAAKEIVIAHHERWDGRGYPNRLKGTEIPLSARIMAISDVYDALISTRPYKTAMPHDKALEIITRESAGHFDPHIINICADTLDEFEEIILQDPTRPYALKF